MEQDDKSKKKNKTKAIISALILGTLLPILGINLPESSTASEDKILLWKKSWSNERINHVSDVVREVTTYRTRCSLEKNEMTLCAQEILKDVSHENERTKTMQ